MPQTRSRALRVSKESKDDDNEIIEIEPENISMDTSSLKVRTIFNNFNNVQNISETQARKSAQAAPTVPSKANNVSNIRPKTVELSQRVNEMLGTGLRLPFICNIHF